MTEEITLDKEPSPLFYDVLGTSNERSDETEPSSPNSDRTRDPESLAGKAAENIVTITNRVVQPVATLAENTVGRIIPKIEPLPWYQFIFLSIIVAIP